jgi:predicted Na+-dependent transporter
LLGIYLALLMLFCRGSPLLLSPPIILRFCYAVFFQFVSLTSLTVVAWFSLKLLFPNKPKLRVMGLFGCTHKTVAVGIPLINAIYENNPSVGLFTLPLLIWHPMQLVIGTLLAPRLIAFVKREELRLGIIVPQSTNNSSVVEPVDNTLKLTEEGQISPTSQS